MHLRLRPLPQYSHPLPESLQLLSNTMEVHRLLLNSHSTLLIHLPLNSSSTLMHCHLPPLSKLSLLPHTQVLSLHITKPLLPQCRNHSNPSLNPSPPSPQLLHPSASLCLCLAHPLLPKAPFHLEHQLHPLNLGLFLLVLLQLQFPLASTQAPCHPNSSPLQPSHPLTTQVPLLPVLSCLPLPWPRATTCFQDHKAQRAPLGSYSSLQPSPACREDTLLSRMVRVQPLCRSFIDFIFSVSQIFHLFRSIWASERPSAWICRPLSRATKLRSPCTSTSSCSSCTEKT